MTIYLKDIPIEEAKARFIQALTNAGLLQRMESEEIPIDFEAVERILAEPVWAIESSPPFSSAAMDGFAVHSADTLEASPSAPVILSEGSRYLRVDTGDPLPDWADTVVPIEEIEMLKANHSNTEGDLTQGQIRLRNGTVPWQHVRPMGEDITVSQLVLPSGKRLRPFELGAAAASGHSTINVVRRPKVGIIPTGYELVPVGEPLQLGCIIEFNSIVLSAQVKGWGGIPHCYSIVPDEPASIAKALCEAAEENDLVLLLSGSSAGRKDFSVSVIAELGEVLVHGVAVKPGHPVILGLIKAGSTGDERITPVIGIPGFPISAALTAQLFVEPLLACWEGRESWQPKEIDTVLTKKVTSPAGELEYLRVVVCSVDNRRLAVPLPRGSGMITSLVQADGHIHIPVGVQGLEYGSPVKVELFRELHDLENTILITGSHDPSLDLLVQNLTMKNRRLVSTNVGSQAGLLALGRGDCHFAGCHLLDVSTGEYNLPFLRKYLPGRRVKLVTWAEREQGLIVQFGNPLQINGLTDLVRKDVRFVNRQRGSGTRVLLDHEIGKVGISHELIQGYGLQEFTHLGVAAAVASGRADCGLGLSAAARALHLVFIPLFKERFDLAFLEQEYKNELLKPVFSLMTSADFKKGLGLLPGYDFKMMGQEVE